MESACVGEEVQNEGSVRWLRTSESREALAMNVKVEDRRGNGVRIAGTALLLLAALMFVGSFVVASKTPIGSDLTGCRVNVPCDPNADPSKRQEVFFLAMGATLIVFAGGVVVRSIGRRS
jgi:hypothetical protein